MKIRNWMMTGKRIVDTERFALTVAPGVWFLLGFVIVMAIFLPTK